MLDLELSTATDLARKASNLVLDYYHKGVTAQQKVGVDNFTEPVTVADKAASRLIVDGLNAAFKYDFVLSEEEQDIPRERVETGRVWMIDPIDGTWGFIKKDGDFAVQIGLVEDGRPVLGVVMLPYHDLLYWGVKNEGAWMSRKGAKPERMLVSANTDFRQIDLAVSRNHRSPKINRIMKDFRLRSEIQRGSVGVKMGLIAERCSDLYIHLSPRTKFWDTCGPEIILEEAGGRVTDLFGEPICYSRRDVQNHGGIVASNGAIHDEAIKRLRPLLHEFGRLNYKPKAEAH